MGNSHAMMIDTSPSQEAALLGRQFERSGNAATVAPSHPVPMVGCSWSSGLWYETAVTFWDLDT